MELYPKPLPALKKVEKLNIPFNKINRAEDLKLTTVKRYTERVRLALTFSLCLPNLPAILKRNRYLLHRSERMQDIFPSDLMVAYKRGRNLKDKKNVNLEKDEEGRRNMKVDKKTKSALTSRRERVTELWEGMRDM